LKHLRFVPFALVLSLSVVLLGTSCKKETSPAETPAGFEKALAITLTNPGEAALPHQAIVIPVGQIAAAAADFNPLNAEFIVAGTAVPYQADDLDGDGKDEKFVLCGVPTESGAYQWLVYDPARDTARGIVAGAILFVGRGSDGGFPRLETYWKQGGDMSIVYRYVYAKGRYARTGTRALTLWETSEYFRAKPPLDLDRELAEIK